VIQQLFVAGMVDELHVDLMPLFLGSGLRLFDHPTLERVQLEKIAVREVGTRTSFRFRVKGS
jgi:dihydrofolate reductase